MTVLSRIIRGCGNLPYVGPHPGLPLLALLTAVAAVAGIEKGIVAVLVSAASMFVMIGGFCLIGSYHRAKLSDQIECRRTNPSTGADAPKGD